MYLHQYLHTSMKLTSGVGSTGSQQSARDNPMDESRIRSFKLQMISNQIYEFYKLWNEWGLSGTNRSCCLSYCLDYTEQEDTKKGSMVSPPMGIQHPILMVLFKDTSKMCWYCRAEVFVVTSCLIHTLHLTKYNCKIHTCSNRDRLCPPIIGADPWRNMKVQHCCLLLCRFFGVVYCCVDFFGGMVLIHSRVDVH